jgi:cyclase
VRLDRVAEDIFILVSELYAQVTATVLLTTAGAIVVDTMPFPAESRQVVSFVEQHLGPRRVRYVVNTHHHADHTCGNYLFEEAEVLSHALCREALARVGAANLERVRQHTPALADVELRLPDITFQQEMYLHLGQRHLRLMHTPGHTADGISVFVLDEKVLIAGDTIMPVPHIVAGDYRQFRASLLLLRGLQPNFVVQGHGDILLRGEVDEALDSSVHYLDAIVERVRQIVRNGDPPQKLRDIDIESCGKSRIPLDGLVSRLHADNLVALYKQMRSNATQ